jgi:hypothetical protein
MQQRIMELEALEFSFHIQVSNGEAKTYGDRADSYNANYVNELIEGIVQYLPNMTLHLSGHDAGNGLIGEDTWKAIVKLNRVGQGMVHGLKIVTQR